MHNTFQCSLKHHVFSWFVVLAMAVGLCGSVPAAGQTGALGTPGAGFNATVTPEVSPNPINPFVTYHHASYGTGGVALRNRRTGVLNVSGVSGPVQDAYLYWAVLFNTQTAPPAFGLDNLWLWHVRPSVFNSNALSLRGTLLGIGTNPCWGSTGAAVYRAHIPSWWGTGNGAYQVEIKSTGRTDGSDPWVTKTVFPAWEGASLVIIGTGDYTVGVYDAGLTARTFGNTFGNETLTYTLQLPGPLSLVPYGDALWDNIGAGGYVGQSRAVVDPMAYKTTTINGTVVAGPGTAPSPLYNVSDWNGSAGLPIPQLWDDTGHDIFPPLAPGVTTAKISFYAPDDASCLVTVANVLAVK